MPPEGGLSQGQLPLGSTEEVEGIPCRQGHPESVRVREPDILAGHPHQPPSHVQRILPSTQYSGKPVQRRIRIAPPDGLVEG